MREAVETGGNVTQRRRHPEAAERLSMQQADTYVCDPDASLNANGIALCVFIIRGVRRRPVVTGLSRDSSEH